MYLPERKKKKKDPKNKALIIRIKFFKKLQSSVCVSNELQNDLDRPPFSCIPDKEI